MSISAGGGTNESIDLNLNPMLDIFSILITFLLMSFSTDPVNHDIDKDVELPDSLTIVALDELPIVTATPTELRVNDTKIADIIGGDVPLEDRAQGAIFPLFRELERLAEASQALPDTRGGKAPSLTMEMDKSHQFRLIKRIMLTAQQADFLTFKFMVEREGD